MKRFLTLALAGALVLGAGSVAYANICAFDPAPAATLLFPFVAYNYDEGIDGINTLFAVTNVSSEATIVHFTLWSDYSTPVLDWNALLTGYDVYTFNIRDILKDGKIVATFYNTHAEDGDIDLGGQLVAEEGVFDDGPVSITNPLVDPEWDGWAAPYERGLGFPEATKPALATRCPTTDPAYPGNFDKPIGQIPSNVRDYFELLLKGSQTANAGFNACSGTTGFSLAQDNWWDDRDTADDTWMYLTADVVYSCNKNFPDETGYFDNTLEDNVIIGDVVYTNETMNFSEVVNAVHLEADVDIDAVATESPNNGWATTFYARYSNADDTSDYREPLPTAWAFRYGNMDLADGSEFKTFIRAFKAETWTAPPIGSVANHGGAKYAHVADLFVTLNADASANKLLARNCLAYTFYVWDEEENVVVYSPEDVPWSGGPGQEEATVPNLLPLETQEVNADHFIPRDNNGDPAFNFGWMLFVWPASNYAVDPALGDAPMFYQTYMGVKFAKMEPAGVTGPGYSGATDGAVMANYNCFAQQQLPVLGINFDYVDFIGLDGIMGYVVSSGASE